jgi:tripartite-type tricarboxylate transporter receptor subunit TctC
VVRAAPDGYTLLLGPTAVFAVVPHLFANLGFDPLASLDPIALLADAPLLAVVGAEVPAKSLDDLARYVRASPGKYNYGSPGTGSPAHLTGAAFSQQTGNAVVYVPYKGTPPMVQALLAGDIQMAFPTWTGIIGPVKAGKLRVLAVMARERMAELPGVPTSVEAGFPQLVGGNWWVLAAPHGTSPRIIERLAADFRKVLADPVVRKRIGELGHVPIGLAPAATAAFLKSESARYKAIVERGGIKPE